VGTLKEKKMSPAMSTCVAGKRLRKGKKKSEKRIGRGLWKGRETKTENSQPVPIHAPADGGGGELQHRFWVRKRVLNPVQ